MAKGFSLMTDILDKYELETDKQKRISREWQDYAYRLSLELDDKGHVPIYMRMCKNVDRSILEEARTFVKASTNAKNKARLFMWKVKELRIERKGKE
jgi:hypothetical protein